VIRGIHDHDPHMITLSSFGLVYFWFAWQYGWNKLTLTDGYAVVRWRYRTAETIPRSAIKSARVSNSPLMGSELELSVTGGKSIRISIGLGRVATRGSTRKLGIVQAWIAA